MCLKKTAVQAAASRLLALLLILFTFSLAGCEPGPGVPLTTFDLPKGPDLIYTGSSSEMKIFWHWTKTEHFRLDWGKNTRYRDGSTEVTAYDPDNFLYTYTITGLKPGTRYYYRVVLDRQFSAGSFFTAPSDQVKKLKFVSYGDTRSYPARHDAVAAQVVALYRSDPAYQTINLMTGDLVSTGDVETAWDEELFDPSLKNIRAELANMAVLPVMGNHEGSGELFTRYFAMPFVDRRYWSFDYGPAHFVMLDQYSPYRKGTPQYDWLKGDLAATTRQWKIVVLHSPGWTAGGSHPDNPTVQKDLQPLFEQYGVAMVLGGHNHYYARAVVNGVQHLTIGTGGAPGYSPQPGYPNVVATYAGLGFMRFEINGGSLTGWFVDEKGQVRDKFTLTK